MVHAFRFGLLLCLLVMLVGCYQTAPSSAPDVRPGPANPPVYVPAPRPAKTVVADGSAIVGEITRSLALGFEGFTPGYTIKLGTAGTREGFTLFCTDETDIQQAVREIDGDESALCLRHGVNYLHVVIAYDVLAV